MNESNPIDLLFGGMEKLGPGGDHYTRHVLNLLPHKKFGTIVDIGCGTGRQTLVLAGELRSLIHAVDIHQPFLRSLEERADQKGLKQFIQAHCMDMKDVANTFQDIDLLWSEGAAYNIGFTEALKSWSTVMRPGGITVVSELAWLKTQVPEEVSKFFEEGYPGMQHHETNIAIARQAGYTVRSIYVLPDEAWENGYYDIQETKAANLKEHADPEVQELARGTLQEIDVFRSSAGSYGYVFYMLQRR